MSMARTASGTPPARTLHRLWWLVCIAAVLLLALTCGALGEAKYVVVLPSPDALYQTGGLPVAKPIAPIYAVNANGQPQPASETFETYVARQLEACAPDIDVSAYRLTPEQFEPLYYGLINSRPDLFYVATGYSRLITPDYMTTFSPVYRFEKAELPAMKAAYNAELKRIAAYASQATTTLGKLMLVNDYFCLNYCYDNSLSIFDAYTLFTRKTGVCQAYMLGFTAAMQKLGIPCATVSSDAMNHTWNVVELDGSWYHIDVTWNDPAQPFFAGHGFFLCSNGGLKAHSGWEPAVSATSTKYDRFFWTDVPIAIPVVGDTMYYIKSTDNATQHTIRKWKVGTTSYPKLHSFETRWNVWGATSWYANYFGFLAIHNNRLYYGASNAVFSIPMAGGKVKTEFTPSTSKGYLYGASLTGTVLRYGIARSPEDTVSIFSKTLAIKRIMLPNGLQTIAPNAFAGAGMMCVEAGDSLTNIGDGAFTGCTQLQTVVLGASVTAIADNAFDGCGQPLVFVCPKGSYAESYATRMGYQFVNP